MSNNNNNSQPNNNADKNSRADHSQKDWKIYASLALYGLLGLAIGYAVAKGVLYLVNRPKIEKVKVMDDTTEQKAVKNIYKSEVIVQHEGQQKAELSVALPEGIKITQGEGSKSRYFYVTDKAGANLATMYMSYEGGRGYSASEYISNVVAKYVPSVATATPMIHGDSSWFYTSSASSEWHVSQVREGQWLIVVENKRDNHEAVLDIIETLEIK